MTHTAWFLSIDAPRDPAWHRSYNGYTFAYCGARADSDPPWRTCPPRGAIVCPDCKHD